MNNPAIPASAELILPAPAKLNLMLHILGRRADGYHELQTLFQFLDFGDELGFALRNDGQIHLHTEIAGVPHDSNLIVRAARLLQAASGTALGADIWLDKRLPMGGGIGGGSSDAATTLLGLNHLWGAQLSEDQLAALGLQLGADVPVFVRGRAAFAEEPHHRQHDGTQHGEHHQPDEPTLQALHGKQDMGSEGVVPTPATVHGAGVPRLGGMPMQQALASVSWRRQRCAGTALRDGLPGRCHRGARAAVRGP